MEGGAVLTRDRGGMADLLHSLLVYNDDGPRRSGFSSLSDGGDRLKEEAMGSEEWAALAEAIAAIPSGGRSQAHLEVADAKVMGKPKIYPNRLSQNIDALRTECGWSFDELAKATELDKKLILGHVNLGKGMHPATLELYARTFTEKLGRTVKPADLDS